jgi:hypothetical protein
MGRNLALQLAFWTIILGAAAQPVSPTNVVVFSGHLSAILHWDPDASPGVSGYNVSRSLTNSGPFTQLNSGLVTTLGYCDLTVSDAHTYYYQVTAVNASSQTSSPSPIVFTTPNPFPSDAAFLDYLEEANFDFFWYAANPANGLIPDRSTPGSACSIASVGFGLTAIGIAIDHGWVTRDQGAARVLTTLNTFWNGPQGTNATGEIGYNGWFYHFLDMNTATRSGSSELSSIDTTLLLGGILYAKQYFNGNNATETNIQTLAGAIFNRVNWLWFAPDIPGTNGVRMGWKPDTGFSTYGDWIGYDEAMLLYLLGMGTATNPLPAACWSHWTSGYSFATLYGESYVVFPAMYGHQYSHCWVDFRHVGDAYMNAHTSTYFENSHRAALAQQAYCVANPGNGGLGWAGYTSLTWGLTASDDPSGYAYHGAPPADNDNGTITFTASGGSLAFAPEIALPSQKNFYNNGRMKFWTQYGFVDAFNQTQAWTDNAELGIDQGPIVIMAENYRNQNIWRWFMLNPEIQRGLQQAGFVSLPFVTLTEQIQTNSVTLTWPATSGRTYQVEYSTNLLNWFTVPTAEVTATNTVGSWTDTGPPGTYAAPLTDAGRFYRAFQYGTP